MSIILLLLTFLESVSKLGIVSAMDEELALIKESTQVEKTDTIAQRIFTIGRVEGMPCVCVKAGIGKVNAAMTAQILTSRYNVDAVIFTGVAGGINPELGIGDMVISERVIHHDYGQTMPDKFLPWDTLGFLADSFLIKIASKAAGNVKFEPVLEKNQLPQVIVGRVVTGDQFIASEEKRRWIEETFHADCVEMEGAAVAQVCTINKIPFVIIRCLSDLANEKADIDFASFVIYAAKNSSSLVKEIIKLLNK